MFERFTEQARQVIVFAQEEARELGHDYIGAEHLLLGLLRDPATVAGRALDQAGLRIEAARASLLAKVPGGEPVRNASMPFTPKGKEALEGSLKQAMAMRAKAIGPEQLLLGLLDSKDGHTIGILADQRIAIDDLRRTVLNSTAQSFRQLTALRLEIVDAQVLALQHRDKVMAITGEAATRDEAAVALIERFAISPYGAQAVLDLRVSSFTKQEEQRLAQEQAQLRAAVEQPE